MHPTLTQPKDSSLKLSIANLAAGYSQSSYTYIVVQAMRSLRSHQTSSSGAGTAPKILVSLPGTRSATPSSVMGPTHGDAAMNLGVPCCSRYMVCLSFSLIAQNGRVKHVAHIHTGPRSNVSARTPVNSLQGL